MRKWLQFLAVVAVSAAAVVILTVRVTQEPIGVACGYIIAEAGDRDRFLLVTFEQDGKPRLIRIAGPKVGAFEVSTNIPLILWSKGAVSIAERITGCP